MIILIIILLFLWIGVRITLIYSKNQNKVKGCIKILIFRKFEVYSSDFPQKESESESKRDFGKIVKLAKPCISDIKRFLAEFLKSARFNKFENHLLFGFDSYCDTATYIGWIWTVNLIAMANIPNAKLTAEPVFGKSVIDFNGSAEVDINLLKLAVPTVRLLCRKNVRILIKGVLNE